MGSRLRTAGLQLLVVFAAGLAANAAWSTGYLATFALSLLIGLWTAGRMLQDALAARAAAPAPDERWRAAVLAREREARNLAAFLDHAPVPLLAMRARGALTALNLAARRFFATDDLVADPPEALVRAVLGATPGQRQTLTLEVEGQPRAYALTVSELVSGGDFVRIVALVDIQSEIQAAEATALRELIQVLNHEIMNSLTPVTSLAQSAAELLRDSAAPKEAREAVDSVARRSEGLLRFIEAYRALARLPEPRFAETSVAALLEDVALLFRSRWSGVALELATPPPELTAPLDRDLLAQALINILANAAEAALAVSREPRVALSAERTGHGRLVIAVDDNGPGVDLPEPAVIFRPFFTTKAAGTGVGLSLARQVVLAHGGEIAVANRPEGGARIMLTL
jgi:signal transduction histidine kinase